MHVVSSIIFKEKVMWVTDNVNHNVKLKRFKNIEGKVSRGFRCILSRALSYLLLIPRNLGLEVRELQGNILEVIQKSLFI